MTPEPTKRKAAVQASGTTKKARTQTCPSPAPPSPSRHAPEIPKDASPRTAENNLHLLPKDRQDLDQPWFLYDYVDPFDGFIKGEIRRPNRVEENKPTVVHWNDYV